MAIASHIYVINGKEILNSVQDPNREINQVFHLYERHLFSWQLGKPVMYRLVLTIITLLMLGACVRQDGPVEVYQVRRDNTYVDLESGQRLMLRFDSTAGYVVEQNTNRRVNYFVDEATHDTINAKGEIVNNKIIRNADGSYSEKEVD